MTSGEPRSEGPRSVSMMIERLKLEDPLAATEIWERFFQRLLPLARSKARQLNDSAVDGEDVLVTVFDRFFRAASENRFSKLHDRNDLWQILLMLTEREVIKEHRKVKAKKRGGGNVRRESDFEGSDFDPRELANHDPDPEFIASFNEHLSHALAGLVDKTTREVALLKLEGYENTEIAAHLNMGLSTVERKLRMIREAWQAWFER